ncbi:hypothetical protein LSTR_LSTR008518 [Laodelphax striatellus]|uniref:Uncharacterized protein n=1 Tax=Laodelphax striatellus TaxID=195883 RepID=A0A482WR64_LAOST|nr:hypothetical protein LSTR_LSTR008518 [Laodelphax striatellus]
MSIDRESSKVLIKRHAPAADDNAAVADYLSTVMKMNVAGGGENPTRPPIQPPQIVIRRQLSTKRRFSRQSKSDTTGRQSKLRSAFVSLGRRQRTHRHRSQVREPFLSVAYYWHKGEVE